MKYLILTLFLFSCVKPPPARVVHRDAYAIVKYEKYNIEMALFEYKCKNNDGYSRIYRSQEDLYNKNDTIWFVK